MMGTSKPTSWAIYGIIYEHNVFVFIGLQGEAKKILAPPTHPIWVLHFETRTRLQCMLSQEKECFQF